MPIFLYRLRWQGLDSLKGMQDNDRIADMKRRPEVVICNLYATLFIFIDVDFEFIWAY